MPLTVSSRHVHRVNDPQGRLHPLEAEKIRASLTMPYHLVVTTTGKLNSTVVHHCSASIGVAVFVNHEANQSDILKWADAAMYQAKEAGRNAVRFYQAQAQS